MQDNHKTNWLLGSIGLLGFLIVWIVTLRLGQGITFDSLIYFWVSKSLLAGEGYSYLTVLLYGSTSVVPHPSGAFGSRRSGPG
jgi:hypothetical protein